MKMASTYCVKNGPNNLLRGLIVFSLGIHVFLFLHISGLYRSETLEYIELAIRNEKKSIGRALPRPPMLPRAEKNLEKAKTFRVRALQMPDLNQINLDPGDSSLSSGLMAGISGQSSGVDYTEMIQLRIDREKKKNWVKEADGFYKEGAVSLSFVINPDGTISNLKIMKPCLHESLNRAALQTIRDSVPFPKPPPNIYKGGLVIQLNITFELL